MTPKAMAEKFREAIQELQEFEKRELEGPVSDLMKMRESVLTLLSDFRSMTLETTKCSTCLERQIDTVDKRFRWLEMALEDIIQELQR